MANELTLTDLADNAGLAHVVAAPARALLYDPTDLRAALTKMPFTPNAGSATTKTAQYAKGKAFATMASEISFTGGNTDIGDASFDLTVARRVLKYQMSELWRLTGISGVIDPDQIAEIIFEASGITITDMACATFGSFTAVAGDTSAANSVDALFDGMFALNSARATGNYTTVQHPTQFNQLVTSVRDETGVLQFQSASELADLARAKGPGFKGRILNIDIFDSDSVGQDGGSSYYQGAMFDAGAIQYQEAPTSQMPPMVAPNLVVIDAGVVRLVFEYDADHGLTKMVGDYFPAVSIGENARGVMMRSKS
jgi:hypothetical protein